LSPKTGDDNNPETWFPNKKEGIKTYMLAQSLDKSQFMFFNLRNIATITFSICWDESSIWKNYLQRCQVFGWEPATKGILMRISHPNGKEDRLLISRKKQREIIKKLKELMTLDFNENETELQWGEEE
tara:strand:- start:348 stop:731 length:384 start_codon:yes stop_codon:yes gene_type:complete